MVITCKGCGTIYDTDKWDCSERGLSGYGRTPCSAGTLRKANILIGDYDPCLLCANRIHCGGIGCLGWEPDEDACQAVMRIKWQNAELSFKKGAKAE